MGLNGPGAYYANEGKSIIQIPQEPTCCFQLNKQIFFFML